MLERFYTNYPYLAWPIQALLTIIAVFFMVSLLGGWRHLSASYRTDLPMPANSQRFESAVFRYVVSYNHALRVGSDTQGVYLRCWPSLFHAPLLIPWSDLEVKPPHGFLIKQQTLKLGRNPQIPVSFRLKTAARLLQMRVEPQATLYAYTADGPRYISQ